MQHSSPTLILLLAFTLFSCKKSDNSSPTPAPTPTPTPSVASTLAGVYKLTQLTTPTGSPTITGTNSVTVTALDNTTISLRETQQYTVGTAAALPAKTSVDTLVVAGASSPYAINYRSKTGSTALGWGTATGTKINTNEDVSTGTAPNVVQYRVGLEYTKQ